MTDLIGKVALVTGSSQGIGAGAALSLARSGADVAVNYVRAADLAQEVCEQIQTLGRKTIAIQADVTDSAAIARMVAETEREIGPIDILVNNAGHNPAHNIMDMSEEDWDWVLSLNLKSYFLCSKAVLPGMLEREDGRIINITSISGQRGGFSCDVDYSAAKAGIMGFTRALSRWAAPRGVIVNAIAPGYIETNMLDSSMSAHLQSLVDRVPLKRQGTVQEIGDVVVFLAGPGANYMIGEVVTVNGGAYMD